MDDDPFPFCLVGEEFRCVLGVRYKEDKTESVWRGSNTYHVVSHLQEGGGMTTDVRPRHMGELDPRRSPKAQLLGLRACPPPRPQVFH